MSKLRLTYIGLLLAGLSWTRPIEGQPAREPPGESAAEVPLRVLLRIERPLDREVSARLRGHLNDLPVDLQAVAAEAADATAPAADLQVEFSASAAPDNRYEVWAQTGDGTHALLGSVALEEGHLSSSALEIAALLIRAGVQALLLGEELPQQPQPVDERGYARGHPHAAESAQPTTPAPSTTTSGGATLWTLRTRSTTVPERPGNTAPSNAAPSSHSSAALAAVPAVIPERSATRPDIIAVQSPSAPPAPLQLLLQLGVHTRLESLNPTKAPGAHLWLAAARGPFEAGIIGTLALPRTADDAFAPIRIAQHGLTGTFAARLWGSTLSLWLGAESGVALFHRSSGESDSRLAAAPSRLTPSLVLAPTIDLRFMPGRFGLRLRIALDILPSAPRFVYAGAFAPDDPAYLPATAALRIAVGLQSRVL